LRLYKCFFLICRYLFVPEGTPSQQRLYCCLLFLLTSSNMSKNFSIPGPHCCIPIINVPFVTGTGDGGE